MDALLQSHGYKKVFVSQEFVGSQSSIDVLSPKNIYVMGSYISCLKTKFPVTGRDAGLLLKQKNLFTYKQIVFPYPYPFFLSLIFQPLSQE